MKRPWAIWIAFVLCLAVVLAAMGWVSLTALRVEADVRRHEAESRRQEAEAHQRAVWDEHVRLALWRMDSGLAPFVAQESVRPYFVYSSFLPVNRAYIQMFADRGGGEMLIPSPLLAKASPNILVHFQFEPDGRLTSPQVPVGDNYKLAVPNHLQLGAVGQAEQQLAKVRQLADREKLLAMLPESVPAAVAMVVSPLTQTPQQRLAQRAQRQDDLENRGRGAVEFNERNQAVLNSANFMGQNQEYQFNDFSLPSTDVTGVLMSKLWIDGQLILARRVAAGGREYIQGCLLDWPAVKLSLLEMIEDLLPEADLEPVTSPAKEGETRMLAALPVRLLPGKFVPSPPLSAAAATGALSPIGLSLGVAWTCMLLAAGAVAALLLGVIRLSERRASFVTAVTHELRTPLTTFQMYAEMLSEGMVSDRDQQKQYLGTLRTEAVRLSHLVENVLSYARLERGRGDGRLETVRLDELIGKMQERLADRARGAGMELVVEHKGEVDAHTVRANTAAVEQILFNLVDNACKYAAGADDKRIHLTLQTNGSAAEVRLRDHGPGLPPSLRRRLFRPFSKSAQEAAHSAPGVGLGLALSRRLARDMSGDLGLDKTANDGACFVLTLAAAAGVKTQQS